jgi:hypothetical protein
MNLPQFFQDGGFGMWPILTFGALLLGSAAHLAVRPERRYVPLFGALTVLTLSSGALGFALGLKETAVGTVGQIMGHGRMPPDFAAAPPSALVLEGFAESLNCITFALLWVTTAMIVASIAAVRGMGSPGAPGPMRAPDGRPAAL